MQKTVSRSVDTVLLTRPTLGVWGLHKVYRLLFRAKGLGSCSMLQRAQRWYMRGCNYIETIKRILH